MIIREIKDDELSLLEDFLYEAIFIPEGIEAPPKEIIEKDELQVYINCFGFLEGDYCLVAEEDGKVVGAVWTRIMNDYGHVDDNTPSFAISLYKEYRGRGYGTEMMRRMLNCLKKEGYHRASLAVQKANYAVRMYKKVGFRTIHENDEEYIMICNLDEINSVIFDMDGVIFDSEKVICDLWIQYAREVNLPGIDELILRCIGITDKATEAIFTEAYGKDFPYRDHKKVISTRFHERYDGGKLPKKPGIEHLLKALKESGFRVALASSTRVEVVTNEIRDAGLLDYFDVIIGGDMVSKSKPDPEIFLKAAEELKAKPEECYVIEDSFNGIRAAHAAKMHPIMVPDLLKPTPEILDLCDKTFDSLEEAEKFIITY